MKYPLKSFIWNQLWICLEEPDITTVCEKNSESLCSIPWAIGEGLLDRDSLQVDGKIDRLIGEKYIPDAIALYLHVSQNESQLMMLTIANHEKNRDKKSKGGNLSTTILNSFWKTFAIKSVFYQIAPIPNCM